MSIKAGQLFWEGPKVNAAVSADLSDEGRIPHHPALPAVARWLAGLPAWLDAPELASAIASVVEASREAQARLVLEGDPRGYERGQAYVEACEAIQPHGWEALDALVEALQEVTS